MWQWFFESLYSFYCGDATRDVGHPVGLLKSILIDSNVPVTRWHSWSFIAVLTAPKTNNFDLIIFQWCQQCVCWDCVARFWFRPGDRQIKKFFLCSSEEAFIEPIRFETCAIWSDLCTITSCQISWTFTVCQLVFKTRRQVLAIT